MTENSPEALIAQYEELRRMAQAMRDAQRAYFRTRSRDALKIAKDLEHKVDGLIDDLATRMLNRAMHKADSGRQQHFWDSSET